MASEASASFECPIPITTHDRILLGHGSGGTLTAELIARVFLPAFGNSILNRLDDQAVLEVPPARVAFTTDSFVVTPLFFPGGDIGRLAVHGTINDLAMSGARPLYLSAAFILEEGLPIVELQRVVGSMAEAAREAGVSVVTGDTKVVGRGSCDKMFINTCGIGTVPDGVVLSADRARPGDVIVLSGTLGDHGMAVMSQRAGLGLEGAGIASDTAALHGLVATMMEASTQIHAMRDPTRGGAGATLQEIAQASGIGVEIDEDALPVRDAVRGACEVLGLDPVFVANEGKLIAFIAPEAAATVLAAMRRHPLGREAVAIGRATGDHRGHVVVRTAIGSSRVLERPYGELLPRIC